VFAEASTDERLSVSSARLAATGAVESGFHIFIHRLTLER
jgi:hypothetical protein